MPNRNTSFNFTNASLGDFKVKSAKVFRGNSSNKNSRDACDLQVERRSERCLRQVDAESLIEESGSRTVSIQKSTEKTINTN